jgi:hypothetical protein
MRTIRVGLVCMLVQGLCACNVGTATTLEPPALSSRPEAKHTLYLDFNGDNIGRWHIHTGVHTVPFDIDNDYDAFSAEEQQMIYEIWERVSEDYSPFDLNVTTVDPGGEPARIVIGGNTAAWYYNYSASGVAMHGGYQKSGWWRTGFCFSDALRSFDKAGRSWWTKAIAESVTHESGHLFGLAHFPRRDNGVVKAAYDRGDKQRAPLMGIGFYTARSRWYRGINELGRQQDDVAVLTEVLGAVPDDFSSSPGDALPIVAPHGDFDISGLIGAQDDADVFFFRTGGGPVSLRLFNAPRGANLDAELVLTDTKGQELGRTASDKEAPPLEARVPAGVYYLTVRSTGGYGSLGLYLLRGRGQTVLAGP